MSKNAELIALAEAAQLPNYRPAPFVLSDGEGSRVRDVEGNEYLDFAGGIAVLCVGHCHPVLQQAIAAQAGRLMHVSNLYYNEPAVRLAHEITQRTPYDRVYFANSGTEANEALLKMARRWHHDHGRPERVEIVTAEKSFHGRTMGALAMTGQPKYHMGMAPMVGGIRHVPYNDIEAMRAVITETTAAVVLEPVQGEGGLVPGDASYLRTVRELCDAQGVLLFFDEVQSGFGRTGHFMGWELSGVEPDGCSMAKGMGGGFPIGAIAVKEHLADGLPPGSHASTFGGNALACAAGLAVLKILDDEGLVARGKASGEHLMQGLHRIVDNVEITAAAEVRGLALWSGIRVREGVDARGLLAHLRDEHKLLVTLAGGDVIRLAPPLNVATADIDLGLEKLEAGFREVSS